MAGRKSWAMKFTEEAPCLAYDLQSNQEDREHQIGCSRSPIGHEKLNHKEEHQLVCHFVASAHVLIFVVIGHNTIQSTLFKTDTFGTGTSCPS